MGRPLFRGERYTGAVDGRLDNEVLIVKDKGARDGDGDGLVTLVKFPLVDALPMMAEVDAAMTQQVARRRWRRCDAKYEGAPTIAWRMSGETRTATMSCAMNSPK